mmetsp:Transcript_23153/g.54184  ORF Transcript_23153/g.54184 Transcript_23153/m.54184 type:complete len:88 (-) Transcript_23153:158-421(-)
MIAKIEQEDRVKGGSEHAKFMTQYCAKVETLLEEICNTVLDLLNGRLIANVPLGLALRNAILEYDDLLRMGYEAFRFSTLHSAVRST